MTKKYTVLAIYPDNGQTYAQVYDAESARGAFYQDKRAEQGRDRTVLFVAEGDISQSLVIEPFANGGALIELGEQCVHPRCPARAWSNGACMTHQTELV